MEKTIHEQKEPPASFFRRFGRPFMNNNNNFQNPFPITNNNNDNNKPDSVLDPGSLLKVTMKPKVTKEVPNDYFDLRKYIFDPNSNNDNKRPKRSVSASTRYDLVTCKHLRELGLELIPLSSNLQASIPISEIIRCLDVISVDNREFWWNIWHFQDLTLIDKLIVLENSPELSIMLDDAKETLWLARNFRRKYQSYPCEKEESVPEKRFGTNLNLTLEEWNEVSASLPCFPKHSITPKN